MPTPQEQSSVREHTAEEQEAAVAKLIADANQTGARKMEEHIAKASEAEAKEFEQKGYVIFISNYRELTVHVDLDTISDYDRDGAKIKASVPIKFENGIYRATDPKIIESLRKTAKSNTSYFREEKDLRIAAALYESNRARDSLNKQSSGVDVTNIEAIMQQVTSEQYLEQFQKKLWAGNV